MKTSFKFLYTGIAGLVVATGFAVMPAIAELSDYSPPTDSLTSGYGGFPQWYQDTKNDGSPGDLKLELCVDANDPLCLAAPPPDPNAKIAFPDNFPDEAFWWAAEAQTTTTATGRGIVNGKALLVMATEAAFANGDVFDGDQIVFNRTRIRILGGLVDNTWYRITYPYGVKDLKATKKGSKPPTINVTEDFGCAVTATTECNFKDLFAKTGSRGRLQNPIGRPWLTWDSSSPQLPPALQGKYIGDPNIEHTVTGSPSDTNYFQVQKLRTVNGNIVKDIKGNVIPEEIIAKTDKFSVSGKIFQPTPPATP